MQPREIPVTARSVDDFREVLTAERWESLEKLSRFAKSMFADRPIWCVNSTADGGGVAEMLRTMLSYVRGAGLDARWAVIGGDAEFFAITKRIHNLIHGSPGDGGPLGPHERRVYDRVMAANLPGLLDLIEPGTTVVLHDPQTAGLAPPLRRHGCAVVWRSHVGAERPNEYVDAAWSFIEPYVREADRLVFSRFIYVPEDFASAPVAIVAPSIDPFAPKNQELDRDTVRAILVAAGLLAGAPTGTAPAFRRLTGEIAEVRSRAELLDGGPPLDPERPIVLQVSRWDRLKDHAGVMAGFVRRTIESTDADLVLAGPDARSVSDDPEETEVLEELIAEHAALPERLRRRVHIASLPTTDDEENAAIVNALQRHATIVVQKSIQEGFGLTVTEAMWKARPVIVSEVGGIRDQVCNQRTGVLLSDPTDLDAFGDAVNKLLGEPDTARHLADAGRDNVLNHFLHDRHLRQYFEMLGAIQVDSRRRTERGQILGSGSVS